MKRSIEIERDIEELQALLQEEKLNEENEEIFMEVFGPIQSIQVKVDSENFPGYFIFLKDGSPMLYWRFSDMDLLLDIKKWEEIMKKVKEMYYHYEVKSFLMSRFEKFFNIKVDRLFLCREKETQDIQQLKKIKNNFKVKSI